MPDKIAVLMMFAALAATAEAQTSTPWPVRGPAGSVEVGVEAIAWWLRDMQAPVPLVTNLIVGAPATQTYLGGQDLSCLLYTSPSPRDS